MPVTNSLIPVIQYIMILLQIWNHPDILNLMVAQKKTDVNDFDIDSVEAEGSKKKKKGGSKASAASSPASSSSPSPFMQMEGLSPYDKEPLSYDWVSISTHFGGYKTINRIPLFSAIWCWESLENFSSINHSNL